MYVLVIMRMILMISLYSIFVSAQHELHDDEGHDHDDHDDHDEEPSHRDIWIAIGITTFAGCAAFIGAFSIFCIKKDQIVIIPTALSFSSGVLIYLSFFNLIPESMVKFNHATDYKSESLSHFYCLLSIILGILITLFAEYICTIFGYNHHGNQEDHNIAIHHKLSISSSKSPPDGDATKTIKKIETQTPKIQTPNLSYISYTVAFALIIHHFPEGIATFISLYHELEFGVLVAFGLALHDIPSGICIAIPTYCSTGSKLKPFLLCFCAAIVYPIGAMVGWGIIESSSDKFIDVFMGILFAVTGGIMLYIAFVELLPTAIITAYKYSNTNNQNILIISIILLFIGFLVMDISNILLQEVGHSH